MTKKIIGYKNYEVKILQMAFFNTLWFLNLYGLDFFRPSFWVGTPTLYTTNLISKNSEHENENIWGYVKRNKV